MNRRGFLAGCLALGVAPYVSTMAGVLMPVRARPIWTIEEQRTETELFTAWAPDTSVIYADGERGIFVGTLEWARKTPSWQAMSVGQRLNILENGPKVFMVPLRMNEICTGGFQPVPQIIDFTNPVTTRKLGL